MTEQAFRERFISAGDGLRLYLRDYGDPLSEGTAVLCLAGLTRNSKDFDHVARRLSSSRRVIALDVRGRGRSDYDPDWHNYKPETYLADIMAVLTALNLHPVVICGTSLGGLLAMGLSALSPTVVAGAILNDVGPVVGGPGLQRILEYIGQDRPKANWDEAVAEMKQLFAQLGFTEESRWRDFAEATYRTGDDGLLHFDWDVNLAKPLLEQSGPLPDLWKLYGALATHPVLAVRGGLSDILSEDTLAKMANIKPDLLQVTVPGVGHTPTLDEPEVEAAIDQLLATIDATSKH